MPSIVEHFEFCTGNALLPVLKYRKHVFRGPGDHGGLIDLAECRAIVCSYARKSHRYCRIGRSRERGPDHPLKIFFRLRFTVHRSDEIARPLLPSRLNATEKL